MKYVLQVKKYKEYIVYESIIQPNYDIFCQKLALRRILP